MLKEIRVVDKSQHNISADIIETGKQILGIDLPEDTTCPIATQTNFSHST